MKRIVLLICIGSLTLALTARAEAQNNPPQKKGAPKAQPSPKAAAFGGREGVSNVRQMRPQRTFSTAPFRQVTFKTAPTIRPGTNASFVNRSVAATTAARGQTRVAVTNKWTGPSFSGQNYVAFRITSPSGMIAIGGGTITTESSSFSPSPNHSPFSLMRDTGIRRGVTILELIIPTTVRSMATTDCHQTK